MSKTEVTDEMVVTAYMKAYQEGARLKDYASQFGVSPQYLDWRAKRLRDSGVKLPHKYGAMKVNVEKLNALIGDLED